MPLKKKLARRGYVGALAQPISAPRPKTVLERASQDAEADAAEAARVVGEWLQKLLLLLEHYEIEQQDDSRWFRLAFKLAMEHVPGFAFDQQKPAGRPADWDSWRYMDLFLSVRSLMNEAAGRGCELTLRDACRQLADSGFAADLYPNRDQRLNEHSRAAALRAWGETLEARHRASLRDPLVQFFVAAEGDPRAGTNPRWREHVEVQAREAVARAASRRGDQRMK